MSQGKYETLRVERRGHTAEVVLDRPDKLNTMPPKFFHELRVVFEELEADRKVRAIVLWAEGRLFTAGLDLAAAMGGNFSNPADADAADGASKPSEAQRNFELYHLIRDWQRGFSTIEGSRKPVIAAIHNRCIGGGVDLVTACDIRLCTEDASFAIAETKMAIVADVGTLQRITAIVGKGVAREMAFTGAALGSARALGCGLVNGVYPDKDTLLEAARAMADEIAANSPLAVQGSKMVLNYSDEHTVEEGLEYVAQWNSSFFRNNDLTEALNAFMEKRPPNFRGD